MTTHALKKSNSVILSANGKTVRHNGQVFLIRTASLARFTLADAEPLPQGGAVINLFGRDKLAKELRSKVEAGLVS